ncbi:MAG: chemotaxis protein CheX [Bacillota bacterium]
MRTELTEAFAEAAVHVLQEMLGTQVERGAQRVESTVLHAEEVTVLVGLTGEMSGLCLLTMPNATAYAVVGAMMGEPVESLDEIGRSAVAELGNMIAGAATIKLEQQGISSNITPPSVLQGRSPEIATPHLERSVVPLSTGLGAICLHVSLKG